MPQTGHDAEPVKDIPLQGAGTSTIVIRVFPSDPRFAADVRRLAGELEPRDDDESLRRQLEARLRGWYPRVTVHERTEFGAPSHSERLWYVLRDGAVRPPNPGRDRLHAALAAARDLTADSEAVMDHARDLVATRVGGDTRRDGPDSVDPEDED